MDAAFDQVVLPAGALLFAEGERGDAAYLIKTGRIEIFLVRNGSEIHLASRGPGEIVGEMAIIDKRPRSASARASADCDLAVITAEQISHRIDETDPILKMCLEVVIGRYRETVARVEHRDMRQAPRDTMRSETFDAALKTLSMENELRRALRDNEFELYLQPIVRLSTRQLVGFEALLRWQHPQRGLVPPGEFIPVAEASGLITEITSWCVRQVGTILPVITVHAASTCPANAPLFMTVNISGHDLGQPAFALSIATMIERSGIAPSSLKLEVTESVLMKDPAKATAALEACRKLGVGIAIDDFGTGYSSLSHLSTLPITTIKIDRGFVQSMSNSPSSRKIIHMILRLAKELGIPVVAEGIETTEEWQTLAELGCDLGQGYLFGRPVPLDQTLVLVRTWKPRRAPSAAKVTTPAIAKCA